ncbi:ABC transporter substrate-binding protein [Frankia sp. CNm7]|uniref:ABC transporter substrate-binding protein n=1 Tax=Frankia nepalensis TaxID=1836974 RepID=A0A937R9T0_9ACTN|nr:ABC transporter substrate-binding protein [Frankia nepalensis]MBL7494705.1 ABC transporter substrate-binding protein [Frankia nepalensis]MBL7514126.1 ABC transporter substrate-binding protein [Frankia nepalensis]MBL7523388.1 ABC transporter substrate-binding protein [Frankia nepalensis]MBL7626510.1 ABC transporter substrate-binding protein [Frankia nepalensis]
MSRICRSRETRHGVRLRRVRLAAAVVLTLAAGCGSAGGGGSATDRADTCDTPGFGADEIKIGYVYPDSGPLDQAFAATLPGFIARVEQQNASGGIHGRKIVYEWRDDGGVPEQNDDTVRDLVENEQVFGLVESTTVASGGADYLRDLKIPVVGLPAEPIWSDHAYPNLFAHTFIYTSGDSIDTFGTFVKARGGTKAAVIDSDIEQQANSLNDELRQSLEAVDVEVLPEKFIFNPAYSDPVLLGRQLKAAGVDTVTGALSARDMTRILQGLRAVDAPVKIVLAASGYDRSLLEKQGTAMAGLYTWLNYLPFEAKTPAHARYTEAVSRYVPEMQPPDQEMAFLTYIVTDLFLTGLERGGECPTRAEYIDTLRRVTDYDAGGLLPGTVDLADWGKLQNCYIFVQVNEQGTGYDVTPNPEGKDQWCGNHLP